MDFLRGGFLRRGASNEPDVERQATGASQTAPEPEMEERPRSIARRFPISAPTRPTLFRSRAAPAEPTPEVLPDENEIESPKTPRFTLGMPTLPSTRLHLPHLTRTWTSGSNGPASRPPTARPGTSRAAEGMPRPSFSRAMQDRLAALTTPSPAAVRDEITVVEPEEQSGPRRFDGADPAEAQLAAMAEDGRRRRRGGRRAERERRPPPKHFMFCFPWVRSRRVRSQILRCFVSGLFLIILLAVYLALSITKNINNSEFTVLLILIILFTTIFFCHGLIRLCMLVVRPRRDEEHHRRLPGFMGPGGYAVPREPIRVVLARDEEAAGIESEAVKAKPPAYGLWRESVRVDPNRLFWQRNEEAPPPPTASGSGSATGSGAGTASRPATARPPSYISDDGVAYVVEAQPRSIAPTTDVPLPVHPSEVGRVTADRPSW